MVVLRLSFIALCLLAVACGRSTKQDDILKAELEGYIENKKSEINHRYRLHYHVTPPVGWMNDPNGFSYYNGEYHLFYQFYPYDSVWGPMHWGHASSKDLVHWEQLPTALIPEDEMCFSGSAVVDGDTFTLVYTGRVNLEGDAFNESQYLAFSDDGINFYKYKGNPVLSAPTSGSSDFRDPKVWKHEDYWYMIIGSQTSDARGRVLLYRSEDLRSWEFLRVLSESTGDMGYMWECPDFFELDGRFILLMSPQGVEPHGDRYKNVYQTGYIIGSFDYETYEFVHEVEFQEIDFGHDFYASQTTEVDGKRYVVAWFAMWEEDRPEGVDGWAGALTLVRELKLVGDRLIMSPVDDIISLRDNVILDGDLQSAQQIEFDQTAEIIIQGDLHEKIELLIEGTEGGSKVFITWDPNVGKIIVDRGPGDIRQTEWSPLSSTSWRLFIDASSMELFCGEGEVVFSSRIYPDGAWRVTNLSSQTLVVEAYHLKRSVPV